ncbi:MAG: EF2563 family selenium-dependent molybdenum hydroxylase system protein [Proteobacteria bacterium]|nr:EF2563 family selenium-dependent molybdenum hydroxylase system protein [Pseudomonadota bacterium]
MNVQSPVIVMRGAGDLATGVALRLYRAELRKIVMLETANPLAVRRTVAFSECVTHERMTVEGVTAKHIASTNLVKETWAADFIPVLVDPDAATLPRLNPDVLVDAIIAKRNLGTYSSQAPLVIGLGPGFTASEDVHMVIETMRGHSLGRVITQGAALPNTGIPGTINGFAIERVNWAENAGIFTTMFTIGDTISEGEELGHVDETPVIAKLSGIVRGLLQSGTHVNKRTKLGDVDPRGSISYCGEVSDKALAVGGGVLEAISAHIFSVAHA